MELVLPYSAHGFIPHKAHALTPPPYLTCKFSCSFFLLILRPVLLAGFVMGVLPVIDNQEESVSSQAETFQPSLKFTPVNVCRIGREGKQETERNG